MLVLPDDITLFRVRRKCSVRAKLVRLTRALAAKIDGSWWEIPVSTRSKEAEDDYHWVWRKLIGDHRNDLSWEALAVESVGVVGGVEGAMLYRIDAKSQIEEGEGVVFIDRLATAPRNRPWLVSSQKYQGVGTVLLLAAVRHSYFLGLEGRVWLTSLPAERTRTFYKNRGFRVIFKNKDGTIDCELPAASAQQWLKDEGYLK